VTAAARWTIGFLVVMQCVVIAGIVRRDGPFDHVGMDYLTTWVASDMVMHGDAGRLYDTREQWAYQLPVIERYGVSWDDRVMHPYLAPPPLAIVGLPFALLSPGVALVVWMGISASAVVLAVRRLSAAFAPGGQQLVPLVAGSMPLFALLMLGQADGLLVLGFAVFVVELQRRNDGRAGLSLAVLALKPQLLVAPLVYLVVTGRRRALAAAVLAGLVEAAASVALIGVGGVRDELAVSRLMAGPAGEAVIHVRGMLNVRAAVHRLLPAEMADLQAPLIVVATVAIVAASAWVWRQYDSNGVTAGGIGLLAMTTVLTALHAHYHSGVIALLGVGLVAAGLRERGAHVAAARLIAVTWVSFSLVPFVMFLSVESTRMPAALGTVVLLGLWSWVAWDLAAGPRASTVAVRVPAAAVRDTSAEPPLG